MVNKLTLLLFWPSRHLLHRKVTKEKSKEDIKYYYFFLLWKYIMQQWLVNKTSLKNIVWWKMFPLFLFYFSLPLTNVFPIIFSTATLKHKSFFFVFTSSFKNNIENKFLFQKKISGDPFIRDLRVLNSHSSYSKLKALSPAILLL